MFFIIGSIMVIIGIYGMIKTTYMLRKLIVPTILAIADYCEYKNLSEEQTEFNMRNRIYMNKNKFDLIFGIYWDKDMLINKKYRKDIMNFWKKENEISVNKYYKKIQEVK